jgi:predicted amidohydrolase YtcJ
VTHEYTLLLGATVLPGGGQPPCEALAWAAGTILALGTEADIQAISRGDSGVMTFPGAYVVPLDEPLDVGSAADLLVFERDPRQVDPGEPQAVIRGGHVVLEDAEA